MSKRLTIFLVVLLALTGCEGYETYTPSAIDLTSLAEQYHGDDKPAIQGTAVARYLTAEAAQTQAEQAAAQAALAQATQQAAAAAAEHQLTMLTAEAQATRDTLSAQGTAQTMNVIATQQTMAMVATQQAAQATQVAQATAQAISVQMTTQAVAIQATAEQRAYEATATADALNRQATATTEARNIAATATAQYKADVATATHQAWEAKTTSTAESVGATSAAYQATATRAAEEREIVLGYGRDYGIPLVLLLIAGGLGALAVYGLREYRRRPVVCSRNILGDAEPMAVPVDGGGYTFIDLDRQPGPALQVLPDGQVTAPLLRSPGQEERTTARDQAVDGATRPRLGGGRKTEAPQLPAPPEAPAPGLRSVRILRRLDQAERAGFLPPPLVAALAADWEEEQ